MSNIPTLDVIANTNKKAVKVFLLISTGILIASISALVWAEMNWDEYSTYENIGIFRRKMRHTGIAPTVQGFGIWGVIISGLFISLGWVTTDFKNPTFGVNQDGVFINTGWFRKVFLKWNQIAGIKEGGMTGGGISLSIYDAEDVTSQISSKFRRNLATKQLEMIKSISFGKITEGGKELKKALFEGFEKHQSESQKTTSEAS